MPVEMLKRDYFPSTANGAEPPPRKSTIVKLPPLVEHTANDKQLLEAVVEHYHQALKNSPEAQQYLVKRGLQSAESLIRCSPRQEHQRSTVATRALFGDHQRGIGRRQMESRPFDR